MPTKPLDFSVVRELALKLPNVEDVTSSRGTAFKLTGRLLACEATHKSAERPSLVVRVSLDERARLLADSPTAFYVTEHYVKYPAVLVRLSKASRSELRHALGLAWVFVGEKSANAALGRRRRGSKQTRKSRTKSQKVERE